MAIPVNLGSLMATPNGTAHREHDIKAIRGAATTNGKTPHRAANGDELLSSDASHPSSLRDSLPTSPRSGEPTPPNGADRASRAGSFSLPAAADTAIGSDGERRRRRRTTDDQRPRRSSKERARRGDGGRTDGHHPPRDDGRAAEPSREGGKVRASRSMPLLSSLLRGDGWGGGFTLSDDDERSFAEDSQATETDGDPPSSDE